MARMFPTLGQLIMMHSLNTIALNVMKEVKNRIIYMTRRGRLSTQRVKVNFGL